MLQFCNIPTSYMQVWRFFFYKNAYTYFYPTEAMHQSKKLGVHDSQIPVYGGLV